MENSDTLTETNPISCQIKPPVPIKIGDHKTEFFTGCHVIDVIFPNVFYVEVKRKQIYSSFEQMIRI